MSVGTVFGDCASRHAYKLYLLRTLINLDVKWVFSDISDATTREQRQGAGNPMGQVPTLVLADGRVMPESNAALVYLAQGSAYWPSGAFDQAQVMRWLMFEQNQVDPALAVSLSLQKSLYPVENADIILAYLSPKVERLLAAMADHLGQSDQQWLVGSCCSVADIALYAYVHEAEVGGFTVAKPIQSWLSRCEALPGWVSVTDAMETERAGIA